MSITTYTSPAEIRAVLGVSTTELPDTVLLLPIYSTLVELAIEDVNPDIPSQFAIVSAITPPLTAKQQRFLDLVKLYAPYALANELLVSLPLFAVKDLTDGRASFGRQSDPYADVREGVQGSLQNLRVRLGVAYQALVPGAAVDIAVATFTTATTAGLAIDPVTNA